MTDVIANSTSPGTGNSSDEPLNMVNNQDVFVTYLRNPSTKTGFYIARQLNSSSVSVNTWVLLSSNLSMGF